MKSIITIFISVNINITTKSPPFRSTGIQARHDVETQVEWSGTMAAMNEMIAVATIVVARRRVSGVAVGRHEF